MLRPEFEIPPEGELERSKVSMSEQENLNVVQASYDAFNAHDLEKLSELWAADFLAEQTGEPVPFNGEQHRMFLQSYLTAFPDTHLDVTLMIAHSDYVFVHWTATGTHTGSLHTPTGSSIPGILLAPV
jgi:ketosteroid isomerase-like protein